MFFKDNIEKNGQTMELFGHFFQNLFPVRILKRAMIFVTLSQNKRTAFTDHADVLQIPAYM